MEELKNLTDSELGAKLKHFGVNIGPITGSTRMLYQKKLARLLGSGDQICQPPIESKEHNEKTASVDNSNQTPAEKSVTEITTATSTTETHPQEIIAYYGIAVNTEAYLNEEKTHEQFVVTNKMEALKLVKKIPGSRFKAFKNREDALNFVKSTATNASPENPLNSKDENTKEAVGDISMFKGAKMQELVKMRKVIEAGDVDSLQTLVWSNPRYMITAGDTPTILQPGYHYNALHIAANKGKADICKFILDTLENQDLFRLLYPNDHPATTLQRMDYLIDLYLNSPEKGFGETPLHFACKFGHSEVVDVLARHPRSDKMFKNKENKTPAENVCSRPAADSAEKKSQIIQMLEKHCYIPLWRTEDNSLQAVVGEAWSPNSHSTPSPNHAPARHVNDKPYSPVLNVKAFAGPMSPKQALKFRREWLTPPVKTKKEESIEKQKILRSDNDKGLERIGRVVADNFKIPWSEYWDFLGCFVDIRSPPGLNKLERYLENRTKDSKSFSSGISSPTQDSQSNVSKSFNDSHSKSHDGAESSTHSLEEMFGNLQVTSPRSLGNLSEAQQSIKEGPFGSSSGIGFDVQMQTVDSKRAETGILKQSKLGACLGTDRLEKLSTVHGDSQAITIDSQAELHEPCSHGDRLDKDHLSGSRSLIKDEIGAGDTSGTSESTDVSQKDFFDTSEHISVATEYYKNRDTESCDSFHTAPEPDLMEFDTSVGEYYIAGETPTKADLDVLNALSTVQTSDYPHIEQWRKSILEHSVEDRKRWKTPKRDRHRTADVTSNNSWVYSTPTRSPLDDEQYHDRAVKTNLMSSFMSV